jgi:hypothetical protein
VAGGAAAGAHYQIFNHTATTKRYHPPCLCCDVVAITRLVQHLLVCSCCTTAQVILHLEHSWHSHSALPQPPPSTARGLNAQGGLERASSGVGAERAPLPLQCTGGRRSRAGCCAPPQQALTWGVPSDLSQVTHHRQATSACG